MKLTLPEAIEKLNGIFEMYSDAQSQESPLIGDDWKAGKVYEAYILSVALNHLVHVEGFQAELIGSSKVHLKSSPGTDQWALSSLQAPARSRDCPRLDRRRVQHA